MTNFCTLFDSNYLTRGLALYESLVRVCPSFHLYVVAFDKDSYEYLKKENLKSLTPISLSEFEDPELLQVKATRSAAEYCWTCTPSIILYCIKKYKLSACTYLDADMIFYSNPDSLLQEMGNCSVLISEHRYTREYDNSKTNGKYCVQFMCFKDDLNGMEALKWWRDRCLEWCYARLEDGKFGDQKYLDDWLNRFAGVHVLQHIGGGVAPWNVQQFKFSRKGDSIFIYERATGKEDLLVFFHFHGLKFYKNNFVSCAGSLYHLNDEVKNTLYFPYIKSLQEIGQKLNSQGISFNTNGSRSNAPTKQAVFSEYIKERLSLVKSGKISPTNLKQFSFKNHYHLYNLKALNALNGTINRS